VRHSKTGHATSALGQKQTSDCRLLMSAIPPKADIVGRNGDLRFANRCNQAFAKGPFID
jgi:hypothetical protein